MINSPKHLMTVMVAQEDHMDKEELPICTLGCVIGCGARRHTYPGKESISFQGKISLYSLREMPSLAMSQDQLPRLNIIYATVC